MSVIILFKGLTAGYFISVFAGIAAIFALFETLGIGDLFGILALIWVLFCAFFFNRAALKRITKINDILLEHCECRRYIAECEKLFAKATRKTKDYLLLNLSTGYIALGDFGRALSLLKTVNSVLNTSFKATYYNNLISVYLNLKDYDNAKAAQNAFCALLNNKINTALKNKISIIFKVKECFLNIETGNYANVEETLLQISENEKKLFNRVAINYYLAKLYLKTGESEKAEKAIGFAAANGGDTYYAQKAKNRDFG